MATFYNQATLSYGDNVTNSNITEGEVIGGSVLVKTAFSQNYGKNDGITYAVTITNSGASALNGLTLTDNLGAYTVGEGPTSVIPLTYVEGSLYYYLDGIATAVPVAAGGPPLTINGITVPAGSTAMVIYEAEANAFAPLTEGSEIENTVTVTGDGVLLSASATVPVRAETSLTIAKTVCPEIVREDGELTYTFVIQNTGNTAVIATDGVIVTDIFNPILNSLSVTLNGEPLAEGTGYNYDNTTGAFETVSGAIPVPGAIYTQDAESGVITLTPGIAVLRVTGTV